MKIALLMIAGLDRPAGVRYFSLARGLVKLGHSVTILALHPNFATCKERDFERDGVFVRYVGQMHVIKDHGRVRRFGPLQLLRVVIQSTWAMTIAALQLDVDCYHIGKPQPINGMAGLIASRVRRRPLYIDCDDYEALSNRFGQRWQQRVFAWWEDHLPAFSAGATANTTFLAERARTHGAPRVVYVPNGVDRTRFAPLSAERRAALRASLGFHDEQVIGYVGSLSLNNHPVDLLLHGFALLAQHNTHAKLLIVGGGEDAAVLRAMAIDLQIAERVIFTGQVPLSAVAAFTSICDLTVDPVHDDFVAQARCPLKLIESLALGVPVITGDVGDRRRLLADGKAGLLVEPGSAEALCQGMVETLERSDQVRAMAEHARHYAARYAWDVLAREWQTVYT